MKGKDTSSTTQFELSDIQNVNPTTTTNQLPSTTSSISTQPWPIGLSETEQIQQEFDRISSNAVSESESSPMPPSNNDNRHHPIIRVLIRYSKYVGPGLMVSVSYMDPGNYSTNVSAGASSKFALLCIVLLSNLLAIFLQSLSVKLGTVTGMDYSRCCRKHLPAWLNITIYVLSEVAIIATDLAEVIGSAIAMNILFKIPLPAGVVITIADTLIVMFAYRPGGTMTVVKLFECMVGLLVLAVVICFCVQLSYIPVSTSVREVFRGYAPSSTLFKGQAMYDAIGILGATVMPHSIILGSGLVQSRLRDFDVRNGYIVLADDSVEREESYYSYKPTYTAIKYSYKYSLAELAITLFTFALFINSAILIVAGATLYGTQEAVGADLYSIHDLLSKTIAPIAGTIFMVSLFLSATSSVFVVTIAGQMVSEGHINWKLKPWLRRLVTRMITIVPTLVISISIGRGGLSKALNASQVILSILLPFIVGPLIYFTSSKKIMNVAKSENELKDMSNGWPVTVLACFLWVLIFAMNVYGLVQVGEEGI